MFFMADADEGREEFKLFESLLLLLLLAFVLAAAGVAEAEASPRLLALLPPLGFSFWACATGWPASSLLSSDMVCEV